MDNIQTRVQGGITSMIKSLDTNYIRKLQGDMYRCSAKCCDNKTMGMDDVQRCVETCSQPLQVSQDFISQELQSYQDRLQRCALDCQDKIRDKMGATKSSNYDSGKHRQEMETCVVSCADKHIELIPTMMKRIEEVLKEQQKKQLKLAS